MTAPTETYCLETPAAALEWIRLSLIEMSEFRGNPLHVTYETRLTRKMIEFLNDRAHLTGVKLRLPDLKLTERDTIRDLISQIDTDGRF